MTREEAKEEVLRQLDGLKITIDGNGNMQANASTAIVIGVLASALGTAMSREEISNKLTEADADERAENVMKTIMIQLLLGRGMSEKEVFKKLGIETDSMVVADTENRHKDSIRDPRF